MRASWVNGLALLNVTLLTLTFLSLNNVSADESVVDEINISISQSCTLIGDFNDPHTAQVSNNTYQAEIGTTTLKAFCNDSGGFAIYAIGFTGDEDGNTDLEGMGDNSHIIATGLATSGETSNWAMKLTATGSSYVPTIENSFNAYHLVPGSWQKVASYSSATDIPTANYTATGSTLTTTYAVFVSPSQTADTYHGRVKYTLVHPVSNVPNQERTCAANTVCYWPNAGDMTVNGVGVVDSMGDQTLSAETTLWASNFKRAGYGFVGWSDKYDWELNANDASGNGTGANAGYHIYGPNQTLTLNTSDYSGTNGGLSLYAVWAPSAGSLQSWNGCSSLGSGKVTALTDTRDQDTYAVAKLADGNCWMIENLRLDYNANITTSNTQSNNGAFGGVFAGLAQPETANFTATTGANDATNANSLYYAGTGNQGNLGATIDIVQENYAGYRMPRYRNDNTNTNSTINPNTNVANMTGTGQNVYSYGNYYTWAAAIADTSYYSTNNQSVTTTSLCPTGWRLPKGGDKTRIESNDDNEFWNLIVDGLNNGTNPANYASYAYPHYNGSAEAGPVDKLVRTYPNNFLYSGRANTSSVDNGGSYGYYWSSTALDNYSSYYLHLNSSYVNPGTNFLNKYRGYSIRCLVGS